MVRVTLPGLSHHASWACIAIHVVDTMYVVRPGIAIVHVHSRDSVPVCTMDRWMVLTRRVVGLLGRSGDDHSHTPTIGSLRAGMEPRQLNHHKNNKYILFLWL